jgi:glycosyltransferase involved in cell wall biosynthesis
MQPSPTGADSGQLFGDQPPVAVIYRSPLFNASETFVRANAVALGRYRALLAGLEDKGNIPPELSEATFLPRSSGERLRGRLGDLAWLASRLERHDPRLVHAHFGPDGLAALDLARRLRVPLVTTLHGYDVSRTTWALLMSGRVSWLRYALGRRRLIREGDLFLAVSDAVRRLAVGAGYPAERTMTHYLGVDLAAFPVGHGDREATVLHVGRLVEKKGTGVLLDAFARVRAAQPAARLVIIGDGPLRGSLEALADRLGLGEAVRFLGSQPHASVAEWMRRAAVLAVPSVTARDGDAEGLPTVVMEAAASGLAVVGSDHSGIPEAIDDGRSGFVVAEGEALPLARSLTELLVSRDLRRSMGAAGRYLAERRFDRVRQFARLEALYDDLIARRAVAA